MKLKRIFALLLAFAALALSLTACSSAKTEAGTSTVKLGVVGGIYEDLWKPAQEALEGRRHRPSDRAVLRLCDPEQRAQQRRY